MSISKKLYVNFGAVLLAVVVLFTVIVFAVHREQSAKAAASQALEMSETTDHIRFQVMQNRLYLSNYLLSGDSREVERMNDGVHQLTEELQNGQKSAGLCACLGHGGAGAAGLIPLPTSPPIAAPISSPSASATNEPDNQQ